MSTQSPLLDASADLPLWIWVTDPAATYESISRWDEHGLIVRVVRGRKMHSRQDLFDEFAAALQFPWYFGENWGAFDECLTDLEWLPQGKGYVVVVSEPLEVLDDRDSDLVVLARSLMSVKEAWATPVETGEAWDRPAMPFHVVLQTTATDEPGVHARWLRAGANVAHIDGWEVSTQDPSTGCVH